MPLGPGVRYRVKHTPKGNVRLAFRGNKVVEATKMPSAKGPPHAKKGGPMQSRLADMKTEGRFGKKRPKKY